MNYITTRRDIPPGMYNRNRLKEKPLTEHSEHGHGRYIDDSDEEDVPVFEEILIPNNQSTVSNSQSETRNPLATSFNDNSSSGLVQSETAAKSVVSGNEKVGTLIASNISLDDISEDQLVLNQTLEETPVTLNEVINTASNSSSKKPNDQSVAKETTGKNLATSSDSIANNSALETSTSFDLSLQDISDEPLLSEELDVESPVTDNQQNSNASHSLGEELSNLNMSFDENSDAQSPNEAVVEILVTNIEMNKTANNALDKTSNPLNMSIDENSGSGLKRNETTGQNLSTSNETDTSNAAGQTPNEMTNPNESISSTDESNQQSAMPINGSDANNNQESASLVSIKPEVYPMYEFHKSNQNDILDALDERVVENWDGIEVSWKVSTGLAKPLNTTEDGLVKLESPDLVSGMIPFITTVSFFFDKNAI